MDLAVAVAVISAVGAVMAALVAGRFAQRSTVIQAQATRVAELEKRLASQKEEVYRPMVELLQEMWDSVKATKKTNQVSALKTLSTVTSWLQIYASDHVVIAFHKMMQAAYSSPPPEIMMRYIAELVLAFRRDLGYSDTRIGVAELLGIRISDFYEGMHSDFQLEEEEFLKKVGWAPPWGDRFS